MLRPMTATDIITPNAPAPALTARAARWGMHVTPGLLLCLAISGAAYLGQAAENRFLGHALFEALVLAILIGVAVRAARPLDARWEPGIRLAAKPLLEVAVLLLGASVDLPALLHAGPALLVGIVLTVTIGIFVSYGISRSLGLTHRMSLLVACGNSICGNSAIAAVAPVIGADGKDVASSIAFTAILGVVLVLLLPMAGRMLGLSLYQYGVVAGLTVYAVPQVMAATFPISELSGQVGTLVKLARVLLLGPVVLILALGHRSTGGGQRLKLHHFVPWFIVGFVALAIARSAGLVPSGLIEPMRLATAFLMVLSMAALGLGVELRGLAAVGSRVTLAVSASLVGLLVASVSLIHLLRIH